MAYTFKKHVFGFMDLLRFKKMVKIRSAKLEEGSSEPLPASYAVNKTAAVLHPGKNPAVLEEIIVRTPDTKTFVFKTQKPFYFRAGQYATLTCKIGDSLVSRPYAISSSPEQGLACRCDITIKNCGFFSGYMCDSAKVGDSFVIGDPSGEFCYEPIKGCKNVVGVAGGSGITPFYSMAQAIADGTDDYNLTIFYGAKTEGDIAFKAELDKLACDKIKVVYVLSDEQKEGFEHGFVSAEIIKKYVSGKFALMMCGPKPMYDYADKEYACFGVEPRLLKKEANCLGTRDVAAKKFKITVHTGFDTFVIDADSRETILTAIERAGIPAPSKCRAGGCGFCHSRLIKGKFTIVGGDKRRLADQKFGYIHTCCSYPDSDMEISVPRG